MNNEPKSRIKFCKKRALVIIDNVRTACSVFLKEALKKCTINKLVFFFEVKSNLTLLIKAVQLL